MYICTDRFMHNHIHMRKHICNVCIHIYIYIYIYIYIHMYTYIYIYMYTCCGRSDPDLSRTLQPVPNLKSCAPNPWAISLGIDIGSGFPHLLSRYMARYLMQGRNKKHCLLHFLSDKLVINCVAKLFACCIAVAINTVMITSAVNLHQASFAASLNHTCSPQKPSCLCGNCRLVPLSCYMYAYQNAPMGVCQSLYTGSMACAGDPELSSNLKRCLVT